MGKPRLSADALGREIDQMADGVHQFRCTVVDDFAGALDAALADVQQIGRRLLRQVANWRLAVTAMIKIRQPARHHRPLTPVTQ